MFKKTYTVIEAGGWTYLVRSADWLLTSACNPSRPLIASRRTWTIVINCISAGPYFGQGYVSFAKILYGKGTNVRLYYAKLSVRRVLHFIGTLKDYKQEN